MSAFNYIFMTAPSEYTEFGEIVGLVMTDNRIEYTDDEIRIVQLLIAQKVQADVFCRLASAVDVKSTKACRRTAQLAAANERTNIASSTATKELALRLGISEARYEELFTSIYALDTGSVFTKAGC